jgi:hypothetical protein
VVEPAAAYHRTSRAMTAGTHRFTVQAVDSSGAFKATEYITVH